MENYYEEILEIKGAQELHQLVAKWENLAANLERRTYGAPIVLPDIIVPVVEDLMEGKSGRLWETDENSFYAYWKEMKQRTKCRQIPELRPYSCRHTTATTLADRKVSASIIQEVMRHAKLTTTRRYVHLDQNVQADAMNAAFGEQ